MKKGTNKPAKESSYHMPEKVEEQVGRLIMMHLVASMAANNLVNKAQVISLPYDAGYTREAKQAYNDIQALTKRLTKLYDLILDDTMPALETDRDNSECNRYDSTHQMTNIFLAVLEKVFAVIFNNQDNIPTILNLLDGYSGGKPFLTKSTKDGLIRL